MRHLAVLTVLLGLGCGRRQLSAEEQQFAKLLSSSAGAIDSVMRTLPMDKQLAIYLFAQSNYHPPHTGPAEVLMRAGPVVVPAVVTRLRGDAPANVRRSLYGLVWLIACGGANLRGERELIAVIADDMRRDSWWSPTDAGLARQAIAGDCSGR